MAPDDLGPDEYELLARLASAYYDDGLTQEALGREFGLSRQKVQRLLDRARTTGVVEIRISAPPWVQLELERRVRQRHGLAEVIVAPARQDSEAQREEVARAAARFLERRLQDGSVVAVSHGRDTGDVPRFFRPAVRMDVTFVSAMGGSPHTDAPTNPNEIARSLAERSGGTAVALYAPAYVQSEATRDELLQHAAVADTLQRAGAASIALVGIGGTDDECTMVRTGCVSQEELRRLREAGAVGDVVGNYADIRGRRLESPETARLIGLSIDDLHRIDTVVAVVSEREKPLAIRGVLATGVVDVLIVDEHNARILAQPGGPAEPGDPAEPGERAEPGGPAEPAPASQLEPRRDRAPDRARGRAPDPATRP
jgi:DNA-binding transcriptional regulator LsrR (DeoR family)